MPKPGLRYFIGSFLLSLAAVFVATKAYLVIMWTEQQNEQIAAPIETKNIELFAADEENDPIYEKYKQLAQADEPLMSDASEISTDTAQPLEGFSDEALSEPETETLATAEDSESLADAAEIADIEDTENTDENTVLTEQEEDEELQIADAAEAPVFKIPLKHNYNIEGGTVTVSDTAQTGKIALASHDVSVYNLGTENQADITEPLETNDEPAEATNKSAELTADVSTPQMVNDNPWDVAETSNKYAAKNSLSVKSQQESADVDLPAQEAEVAYKMQKNILIPIPEDIMNEENLTPQFSTSKENLKLEEELRAKHQLPALNPTTGQKSETSADQPKQSDDATGSGSGSGSETGSGSNAGTAPSSAPDTTKEVRPVPAQIPSDDTEKDFDDLSEENDADAQTSKNLTDSVAAWFSGIKSKVTGSDTDTKAKNTQKKSESGTASSGNSIFQKLLGSKEQEKNIVPSELKITFQPNKAEISGQTLEWLRAFADNTIENENVVVEIRASQATPPVIQQKRLKLLYKVLADKGVDYHKVNIIFTNREPNSFIIRNVRYASEEELARAVAPKGSYPW